MDEWAKSVPRGPKRRESEPTVDDLNLHKTYDSYRPTKTEKPTLSYDSYKPKEQSIVQPRRRPTAEEYWKQRLSPTASTHREDQLQGRVAGEVPDLKSDPKAKEHRTGPPHSGNSRRSSENLLAASDGSIFTRTDQAPRTTPRGGMNVEQRNVDQSSAMEIDKPVSEGLGKRSKSDGLHVDTELTMAFGHNLNRKCAGGPLMREHS